MAVLKISNLMENKIGLAVVLMHCGYEDSNLMKGTSYDFDLIILDIRTREITNDFIAKYTNASHAHLVLQSTQNG